MRRLFQSYPPTDYIVFERPGPESEPLTDKDYTCKHPTQFHNLDDFQLSRTIGANESVIIADEDTKEIVAIVVRNFAKGSFSIIKKWVMKLIRDRVH